MIVPLQLALKTTQILTFGQPRKVRQTSLTHVVRLVAHSTTSPTPTAMGQ
jgi:hypothetical protein